MQLAQSTTDKNIVLLEFGSYTNDSIEDTYERAFQSAAPDVRRIVVDGAKKENFTTAWACADLFCSLADNIQESFGITPIVAMAAGLPAIVSDWDGYKESVIDGETGYRIPSIQPRSGLGKDIALRHALDLESYDRYIGYSSALVAIDIDKTAAALCSLVDNPELRERMGEAGRKRAQMVYDWAVVMPQYEALWAELENIRLAQTVTNKKLWPARMDPFEAFSHYPTSSLDEATTLTLRDTRALRFRDLSMVNFAMSFVPNDHEVEIIVSHLIAGPALARDVVAHFPISEQPRVLRGIAHLLKIGVIRHCLIHNWPI